MVKDNPYTHWLSSHQGLNTAPIYVSDQPEGIYINILRDDADDEWVIALQVVSDEEVAAARLPGSMPGSLVVGAALPPELGNWVEIGRYREDAGRYILTSPFEATVNGQEKRFFHTDEIVDLLFQNFGEVMKLAVAIPAPDDRYVQWSEDHALPEVSHMPAPQENPPVLRQLIKMAKKQGWDVTNTGGGHIKFIPSDPSADIVVTSSTPSDVNAIRALTSRLRRSGLILQGRQARLAKRKRAVQGNPFYLSVKPEGGEIRRFGPMGEADFWVEDIGEELNPIYTSAEPTYEEIGEQLRERRVALGLTQKTVASMADMSPQYYSDIERAVSRVSQPVLHHIAKVLHSRFEGPLPSSPRRRHNPASSSQPTEADVEHYRFFHGVPPKEVIDLQTWVPGGMVLIGVGKDIGYGISNQHSSKDGWYIHDFGDAVKVYRRAKSGERADKTWRTFPSTVTNLGYNLGFTYLDGGVGGAMKEVQGSNRKYLAVTPSRRTLVIVGPRGVEYLLEGGAMRVDDWIRD